MAVEGDAELAGDFLRLARGLEADAEDDHVVLGGDHVAGLVLERDVEVLAQRVLFDRRRARADVLHAAVEGALVEGVEALAHGAHVHEKHLAVGAGQVVLSQHRLFGRVHAADARTVLVLLIAGADALDEGDALRVGFVGGAQHLSDRWDPKRRACARTRGKKGRWDSGRTRARRCGRGRRRRSRSP